MSALIMKTISILGIVLLVLLCILAAVLLIILFMPVVYRLDAEKDTGNIRVDFKLRWLFGLLRAGYSYPDPGRMTVKLLWFTVFDSEKKAEAEEEKISGGAETKAAAEQKPEAQDNDIQKSALQNTDTTDAQEKNDSPKEEIPAKDCLAKLFAKYEKIKYTIINIYDKIKHVSELLTDEESKLLFSHICRRLGKILRHIRPRRIKADLTFGTGSPDTTGYAYAVYGMLSPHLGEGVFVTPDFTQAILEGKLCAAGHITVFTLLINLLAVLLDRRLRLFIRKFKSVTGSKTVTN